MQIQESLMHNAFLVRYNQHFLKILRTCQLILKTTITQGLSSKSVCVF